MKDRLVMIGVIVLTVAVFAGSLYFSLWAAKSVSDEISKILIQLPTREE